MNNYLALINGSSIGGSVLLANKQLEQLLYLVPEFTVSDFNLALEQIMPQAQPDVVLANIQKRLAKIKIAQRCSEELILGDWNMQFLTKSKAEYFVDSYREIIKRHHLIAVQEVNHAGISLLGRACGYQPFISQVNSRGQAVGFLLHPRLQVVNEVQYFETMNVFGITDLRPALRLDVTDKETGLAFNVLNVHLKSMVGGARCTSPVRREQLRRLMGAYKSDAPLSLVLGDFNCFLNSSEDTHSLSDNGFRLADSNNSASTQHLGGRLDGLFYRDSAKEELIRISGYKVHNFWRNSAVGTALSDHGLLSWTLGRRARGHGQSGSKW